MHANLFKVLTFALAFSCFVIGCKDDVKRISVLVPHHVKIKTGSRVIYDHVTVAEITKVVEHGNGKLLVQFAIPESFKLKKDCEIVFTESLFGSNYFVIKSLGTKTAISESDIISGQMDTLIHMVPRARENIGRFIDSIRVSLDSLSSNKDSTH